MAADPERQPEWCEVLTSREPAARKTAANVSYRDGGGPAAVLMPAVPAGACPESGESVIDCPGRTSAARTTWTRCCRRSPGPRQSGSLPGRRTEARADPAVHCPLSVPAVPSRAAVPIMWLSSPAKPGRIREACAQDIHRTTATATPAATMQRRRFRPASCNPLPRPRSRGKPQGAPRPGDDTKVCPDPAEPGRPAATPMATPKQLTLLYAYLGEWAEFLRGN